MARLAGALLACLLAGAPALVAAAPLLTGVDLRAAAGRSSVQQGALIDQLTAAGVTVVRIAIDADDRSIDVAKRLAERGIAIDAIVDPDRSRGSFQPLLRKLDARGVVLAGLELGAEINRSADDRAGAHPGNGRVFGLDDLVRDPAAQPIAHGLRRYLAIAMQLKRARDRSQLNRHTPIVAAGLVTVSEPGARDAVTIDATLSFLRLNGLDDLVDAYGIHFSPLRGETLAASTLRLQNDAMRACRPYGKRCWITAWGVTSDGASCPSDERARLPIVSGLMDAFRTLAQQRRLAVLIYDAWDTSARAIYRCGALTNSGIAALSAN